MLISSPMSRCETSSHAAAARSKAAHAAPLPNPLPAPRGEGITDPVVKRLAAHGSSASTRRPSRRPLRATDFATGSAGVVASAPSPAPARAARRRSAKNASPISSSAAGSPTVDARWRSAEPRVQAARVPGQRLAQLVLAHLLGAVLDDQRRVPPPDGVRARPATAARDRARPAPAPPACGTATGCPSRRGRSSPRRSRSRASCAGRRPRPSRRRCRRPGSRAAARRAPRRSAPCAPTPEKPCARVRPCTVIIAAPASTSARANSAAFSEHSSQPARCLTVTGMCAGTARRTAATSSAASAGSRISAEPHAPAVTFFAGQPMLMSTMAAPTSTAIPAARASASGSRPKICTANRRPSKLGHIRPIALAAPRVSASAERNSVNVSDRAQLLAHRAKRQIGDRLHRRQQGAGVKLHVSDAHGRPRE